jgi:ABC-2 type transport system ATP-binding protein
VSVTQNPSAPALAVRELTKRFGERTAFEDVSFTVERGEVFGFLGPNGAGKTTTVRTLGTLIAPTSGSATVAGLELNAARGEEIRRRIAIMPEAPGLYLRLSVAENLAYFAGLYERTACGQAAGACRRRVPLAVQGPAPARRSRPRPADGPRGALPRRAHLRARPDGRARRARPDRGPAPAGRDHLPDHPPAGRGGKPLRPRRHHEHHPDELRERLFSKSLELRTREPLPDPDGLLAGLPGAEGWHRAEDGTYVLAVEDPEAAAPAAARAVVAAGADLLSLSPVRHSLEDVYLQLIDTDVEAKNG